MKSIATTTRAGSLGAPLRPMRAAAVRKVAARVQAPLSDFDRGEQDRLEAGDAFAERVNKAKQSVNKPQKVLVADQRPWRAARTRPPAR